MGEACGPSGRSPQLEDWRLTSRRPHGLTPGRSGTEHHVSEPMSPQERAVAVPIPSHDAILLTPHGTPLGGVRPAIPTQKALLGRNNRSSSLPCRPKSVFSCTGIRCHAIRTLGDEPVGVLTIHGSAAFGNALDVTTSVTGESDSAYPAVRAMAGRLTGKGSCTWYPNTRHTYHSFNTE